MSETTPAAPARRPGAGPWIAFGALALVVGAFVGAGTGDIGWFGLFAVIGGPLLTIGLIAKGVEVGVRAARDS